MSTAKLRALFAAGLTYDEVAEANFRSEGWRPDRSVVKRKYEAMGMPPRNPSHRDLLPWRIKPEHNDSIYRHMLQAESRKRQHRQLSDSDRRLLDRMQEELYGRGQIKVIGYHPDVGFFTARREDWDEDIVRDPKADHYSDPGITGRPERQGERTAARGAGADVAGARTQPSGT